MINQPGQSLSEKVAQLVETNLKISEEILATSQQIKKYINWLRILNIIKVVIIIGPIIFGLYYLSPYFKSLQSAFGTYSELLGWEDSAPAALPNLIEAESSPQDLLKQMEELQKSGQLDQFIQR